MEKLGMFFHRKYGVNFKSLRYPLMIAPTSKEDDILKFISEFLTCGFKKEDYKVKLDPKLKLSVIYISDLIRAAIEFSEAGQISKRIYNLNGFTVTPEECIKQCQRTLPANYTYELDSFNDIYKDWPHNVNDSLAKKDWEWKPQVSNTKTLVSTLIKDLVDIELRRNK